MTDLAPIRFNDRPRLIWLGLWFWLLALCLGILSHPALAQQAGSPNEAFQQAKRCYDELNFECSLRHLAQARLEELSQGKDLDKLCTIYKLMATSHVALGHDAQALEAFRQLLLVKPDYKLEPSQVSPKILALLEQAREEMARFRPAPKPQEKTEPAPQTTPRPKPEKQPPLVKPSPYFDPAWSLSGSVLAAVLFGRDADYYHPGAAFRVDAAFQLAPGWTLGPVLHYQLHAKKKDAKTLHGLSALAEAGYRKQWERVALRLPLALGPTMYGRGALAEEGGLAWQLLPTVELRPIPSFSLGLHLGTGGTVLLDRPAQSSYLLLGLCAAGHWP